MDWTALLKTNAELRITDILLAIFTVVLAIATIYLARATKVLSKDTSRNALHREIQNSLSVCEAMLSQGRSVLKEVSLSGLNSLERMAFCARKGIYDFALIREMGGPPLVRVFDDLLPIIQSCRAEPGGDEGLYCEIVRFAHALKT